MFSTIANVQTLAAIIVIYHSLLAAVSAYLVLSMAINGLLYHFISKVYKGSTSNKPQSNRPYSNKLLLNKPHRYIRCTCYHQRNRFDADENVPRAGALREHQAGPWGLCLPGRTKWRIQRLSSQAETLEYLQDV